MIIKLEVGLDALSFIAPMPSPMDCIIQFLFLFCIQQYILVHRSNMATKFSTAVNYRLAFASIIEQLAASSHCGQWLIVNNNIYKTKIH